MIEQLRSDAPMMLVSLAAGFILGLGYFYTLWLTVQRLPTAKQPGLLMFGSYFARTFIMLGAFYLLFDGHWLRLVAMVIGFIIARRVMIARNGQIGAVQEVSRP